MFGGEGGFVVIILTITKNALTSVDLNCSSLLIELLNKVSNYWIYEVTWEGHF